MCVFLCCNYYLVFFHVRFRRDKRQDRRVGRGLRVGMGFLPPLSPAPRPRRGAIREKQSAVRTNDSTRSRDHRYRTRRRNSHRRRPRPFVHATAYPRDESIRRRRRRRRRLNGYCVAETKTNRPCTTVYNRVCRSRPHTRAAGRRSFNAGETLRKARRSFLLL